ANIRDYLGSRSSDSNINNGIKSSIENDPNNFWVLNNGLTILVHSFTPPKDGNNKLTIKGLSIVNGAQTTGAIGSLSKLPPKEGKVNVRFVQASVDDKEIVHKIIQFNNSQNKVEASDFRSTDKIQKRLQENIKKIPNCEYEGGRRGGAVDAIRRRPNLLPSYTVGQALACFHGDPIVAYNQKRNIWVSDKLYSKYFNEETKASHLVCAYSLLRAVEEKKKILVEKSKKSSSSLSSIEDGQLEYFRKRGSTYLLAGAVAGCLETFLARKVPNLFRISFGFTSPTEAKTLWLKLLDVTIPFCNQLEPALKGGLKNSQNVQDAIQTFRSLVQATVASNKTIYDGFKGKITAP
ncbi:MAG: AIPR family protein, partial [Desulfobulbaceae bacterium]|nr:AIPR family protein [Desulfobulbaceae bacterium]